LTGEQVVKVFEGRPELPVDEEEDRFRKNVRDEDQDRAHQVGHREALLPQQLQLVLSNSKKQ
jgi:hypothetical protein